MQVKLLFLVLGNFKMKRKVWHGDLLALEGPLKTSAHYPCGVGGPLDFVPRVLSETEGERHPSLAFYNSVCVGKFSDRL
jgi:hypothetical protein